MRTKGSYNNATYLEAARLNLTVEEYRRRKYLGTLEVSTIASTEASLEPESILPDVPPETDAEIWERLQRQQYVMKSMVNATYKDGTYRATIISGVAGFGKTRLVQSIAQQHDPEGLRTVWIKGFSSMAGVYRSLCETAEEGSVLIIDDCDAALRNPNALNLFKAALDSSDTRIVSYKVEMRMRDDEGDKLPTSIEYKGIVIFITNMDLEAMAKTNPDYEALISRAHYINCYFYETREYLIAMKMALADGMLKNFVFRDKVAGFTAAEEKELVEYIEDNLDKFRELSLRLILKLATHYRQYHNTWKSFAAATLFKNRRA